MDYRIGHTNSLTVFSVPSPNQILADLHRPIAIVAFRLRLHHTFIQSRRHHQYLKCRSRLISFRNRRIPVNFRIEFPEIIRIIVWKRSNGNYGSIFWIHNYHFSRRRPVFFQTPFQFGLRQRLDVSVNRQYYIPPRTGLYFLVRTD